MITLNSAYIKYLACFCLFFMGITSFAQGDIKITGTVLESGGQPVPYATVTLKNNDTKAIIAGTTTRDDGGFSLLVKQLNDAFVEISFIGFDNYLQKDLEQVNGVVNLGKVTLKGTKQLNELVVASEKSTTEFKLDKRVFNVGKDISSTGASALEVLNNVPSVNVNIEGQISLRGSSGVQVLINGKPSVLASEQGGGLGTITADMIEKIEVITNPSAKYEAEGTSGILNIVLKKEEKRGLNGSVTVNTGVPHNHSVGVSINRRTEKFNLFSQLGVGYRRFPRHSRTVNTDLIDTTSVISEGVGYKNEQFYNLVLGADYHITKNSILTLSGSLAYEDEDQTSEADFSFENSSQQIVSTWERKEKTEAINPKYQYELQYKNDIKGNDKHTLLFSALGNFFGKDQSSTFTNTTLSGTDANLQQQTRTDFKETKYTFKLDYTRPIKKHFTIETGAQYVIQDVSNDYAVSNLVGSSYVEDTNLTNIFDYNQNVLGAYGTGAYEGDRFGMKLGLRVENTDLKTLLQNTGQTNNRNFTNLFPSVHTSYKITERFSVQAGYSRRIYRPRLWDLNPFFNIANSFSISTGNPNLLPEFTDSYEVSSIYILENASLNMSVFKRYTTDVIEDVSTIANNVRTARPLNIGTNDATGVEFNAKITPLKMLVLQGDVNYSFFNRRGNYEGVSFDFSASQWSTKWTAKLKLPAGIDVETTGRYESEVKTIQGKELDMLSADLGVRKKIMKGRGVINLSVRDVFASRIYRRTANQPTFYSYSRGYRGRFITIGFSYGFGKGEAMEFSGRKRF